MDGATQIPNSEFEASRWHNSRICVWYFQVCKFQSFLLAKYFISARLGEISHFEFQIHFKDIGHMASSTKKCDDHEISSFCVAFGSFGFFSTSTFPPLKHHQPCTLLQSASHLQLNIGAFGKTKPQKLLDPTSLYESVFFFSSFFFESTPSAFAVCAEGWRSLRVGELHIVASA